MHQLAARNEARGPQLQDHYVESAGTGPWHVGHPPHEGTMNQAVARGIAIEHRGQQFGASDFDRFDLVVAMDTANVSDLVALAPDEAARQKVVRLGAFAPGANTDPLVGTEGLDVPDPYGLPAAAFAAMFDQVETASAGLLDWLHGGEQD